jgi:predicted RNA-binding Zn ribbon-like protein
VTLELIAGHPALDLVNTLDWRFGDHGRKELLASYGDLLRFARESKIWNGKPQGTKAACAHALRRAIELREALAEIFYARLDSRPAPAPARATLERYFQAARRAQNIDWSESPRLRWKWRTGSPSVELPVHALALSASKLMTSDAVDRIRACDNLECRWLFLDTSKNHTRRWCDMQICGNRMKARRFKAAHARSRSSAPA